MLIQFLISLQLSLLLKTLKELTFNEEKSWEENLAKVAIFFVTFKQKVAGIKCHKNSKMKIFREFQVANWLKYFMFYFMSNKTVHAFFYKQLSYKQHQVEIGKKASKC